MEKEFVPYEVALRLKALGFEIKSPYWYNPNGVLLQKSYECDEDTVTVHVKDIIEFWDGVIKDRIDVPTFSQAFRWFRKNHDLLGIPTHSKYTIISNKWVGQHLYGNYNSYEEAELACLEKLLEIVESKK